MASTFTLNSQTYDGRYLQVTLKQTKDAANRRSKITGTVKSLGGNVKWYFTGPTTVKVAGTQRYYRAREGDGTGQSNLNFTGTISEFYVSHNSSGAASVSVELITAIYASATSSKSGTWTLDSIGAATTSCGAPSWKTASGTTFYGNLSGGNGNITVSWNGGSAGTNNSVTGYIIQARYPNTDGTYPDANWYQKADLGNITSTTLDFDGWDGKNCDIHLRIRTKGSAGSSYYSGWSSIIWIRSLGRTACRAPTSISVSPSSGVWGGTTLTISWSGASSGTNNAISGYELYWSKDNSTFSYTKSLNTTATSGSLTDVPGGTGTGYMYYRIVTKGQVTKYNSPQSASSSGVRMTTLQPPSNIKYVLKEDGSNRECGGSNDVDIGDNAVINKQLSMKWDAVPGATSYQVRLMKRGSVDSSATWTVEYSSSYYSTSTNSITITLPDRSLYPGNTGSKRDCYAQVRSVAGSVTSGWAGPNRYFRRSATMKVYNGTSYINGAIWVYNGTRWVLATDAWVYNTSWRKGIGY